MLLGHYAVAFGAKKAAPQVSLGWLVAAAILLDTIWPVLLLSGYERVVIDPGNTAFTPLDFVSYPWSHSLLMSAVWGALFGGLYYALRKDARGALVIGALVVSHWLLDFVTHRPDLPLLPDDGIKLGLGLWHSVAGTLAVEMVLFAGGVFLYTRATRATRAAGRWGLIGIVALMLAIYASAVTGPPPPGTAAIIGADMAQLLFVALMAWVDRARGPGWPGHPSTGSG